MISFNYRLNVHVRKINQYYYYYYYYYEQSPSKILSGYHADTPITIKAEAIP